MSSQNEVKLFTWGMTIICILGIGSLIWAMTAASERFRLLERDTHLRGRQARKYDIPPTANPHTDTKYRQIWLDGWLSEEMEIRKGKNEGSN